MTSKNQLTLPKSAVQALGAPEYFDVEVREGQIILTPVRIQRSDAVRAKLAALGIEPPDLGEAIRWARAGARPAMASEPAAAVKAPERATHRSGKRSTGKR